MHAGVFFVYAFERRSLISSKNSFGLTMVQNVPLLTHSETKNMITALRKTFLIDETRKNAMLRGNQDQERYKESFSCL